MNISTTSNGLAFALLDMHSVEVNSKRLPIYPQLQSHQGITPFGELGRSLFYVTHPGWRGCFIGSIVVC